MAPNPQSVVIEREIPLEGSSPLPSGDEVVISGMAGLFPKCANTVDLMENLYNKVDMVEEVSYINVQHPNLPRHQGKIKDLEKFDAQFFKVTHWQAQSLDSMTRKVTECGYSAIYDAGVNPASLAGTKVGVFVGASFADNASLNLYDRSGGNAFLISGCSRTMLANRISYWIDGKGPSFNLDQACTSSMACLELAYNSIRRGDCDSALVGGCNLCQHPLLCLNMKIAGHLCSDGKTKCFDKNGDGYVRSEAINVLFLQKAKDAKRIYSEICHIKNKYFIRPDANFLALRKSEDLEQFLEEFYSEVKISPTAVEYIEAFGLGIAEADGNELNAIGNFFAKSRSVKVGSVKSNMGHTEAANGVCAVTKMCLAYSKGELPGNLYYDEPQEHIPAVRDGRIQVVTENTPFTRGYTAINNYSFTGANYHALFKGHYKNKDQNSYQTGLPRLILISGRDENGMNKVMDVLTKQPIDPEQIALLHNIHKQNIAGHTGRGYIILDTNKNNETISLARNFEFHSGATRPVCFLYSGMGSQWCGMGTELMRIPVFAETIKRCHKVLDPLGIDLVKILTDPDKTTTDNILNCMVGITAVQIGLTDVLKAIGIVPDHIIGHSVGELGCAYADGCFTAEEIMRSSYSRGLVSVRTPFIKGAMAAIGLGYKEILPLCPPEIEIACHNSSESTTISGPAEVMAQFVSDLTSRGVFARKVPCSNIAFHSKYIAEAGPQLRSLLHNFMKDTKLRSEKWISTSILQEDWDKDVAKYASAEYFVNNLLSPVYFEENASLIPNDAIIIEIAPHGLLQAIVKRSHNTCINVPLAKRGSSDPVTFLLEALGKLYLNGLNSSVDALYPKIEFPVSTETSLLSHLVEWEHSVDWPDTINNQKKAQGSSERNLIISVHDDDYKSIEGHVRNGVNEFPESALLVLVWESFGMYKGKYYKDMSVTFNDVMFHGQVKLNTEDVTRLRLMIHQGSNRFELSNANALIVTGFITEKVINAQDSSLSETVYQYEIELNGNDVYALLCMKGYSYQGHFRSIHSLCANNEGLAKWGGEWAPFLDSLLQLFVLARDHDGISFPKVIQQLSINVYEHKYIEKLSPVLDNTPCYKTEMLKSNASLRCGGIMLEGVSFEDVPKLEQQPGVLLSQEFIPHISTEYVNFETAVSINLQIVEENVNSSDKIKVVELVTSSSESLSNYIKKIADKIPSNDFNISSIQMIENDIHAQDVEEVKLLVVHNLFTNQKNLNIIKAILEKDSFVLTLEQADCINKNNVLDMTIITMMKTRIGLLVLLKKSDEHDKESVLYMPIDKDSQFSWWPRVQSELQKTRRVVLVSERQPHCGLIGFVKHLQNKERKICLVVLNDRHTTSFTPDNDIYKDQLEKNLTINVLKKGQWGSYYYVPKSQSLKNISNVSLTSSTFEDLDNFTWSEVSASSTENVIQVSYAGLSTRDCRRALGNIKDKTTSFGIDFSGIDIQGKTVMGMVATGALGSTVDADSSLLWPVPQCWSLEDAATVPRPYVHAYYCLVIKGNLKRNKTVLVTGGSGALGQAIIAICLSFDCTVYATVRDESKRRFLLKLFPKLKEDSIVLAHDELFYAPLFKLIKKRKCDFVVNCYSGQLREAGMKCVRYLGTFLDVNDVDMTENKDFGMACVDLKSYVAVNLLSLFRPENHEQRKELQKMVANGIKNGTVRPLTRVVYTPSEVSRAFKLVSSGRNRGRALIKMNFTEALKVTPRISFSNGVHIVVCDRTNLGVELIDHLVKKGAKNVIVNVKHGYDTNYLNAKSATWKKSDTKIEYNSEDLQTMQGCENLLNAGQKLDNIAGIFIVQDYKEKNRNGSTEQSDLKAVFNETVLVTNNLDKTSRNICNGMSYFVHISVSTPNIASEYAMSACARICEARKESGLPALLVCCKVPKYEVHREHNDLLSKLELPTVSALFNAMDISLKQNTNNVFMLNLPEQSSLYYIRKLEALIGVRNIEDVDENTMLSEICAVNEARVEEIKRELSPITDSVEDLGKMLVGSLKKMCKSFNRKNTNFNKGLGAFYDYVDENEYVAVDAVIPMNTYLTSFEEFGFLNRNETYLIMIPGFEGHHQVFNFLAERIKVRAATLQLGPDLQSQSIPEIAKTMANVIKTNFEMSSKFYILGYSFGVNVALEVAKILEAEGKTGVVYCLDSSPDVLKVQLDAYAGNLTDHYLENNILQHMYRLISGQEDTELKQNLDKLDSWSEKLEACYTKLRSQVHFSSEHIRGMLQSAFDRIKLAKEYEPEMKLQSEIVLIRGIPHPNAKNLPADYNLSKYTTKPVRVFDIESDHVLAPYDCRVSNVINNMLDSKILEEFKKRNLCKIYYI